MSMITLENARGLLNTKRSTIELEAAEAEAKAKAAAEAEAQLVEAVIVQKFFKRSRMKTIRNAVGDSTEVPYSEIIRVDEQRKGTTMFDTTGASLELGAMKQGYKLSTLVSLELSTPSEFNDAVAALDAHNAAKKAASCC
jgi:hypothetical protein